jgi:hypothetical protein
MKNMMLKMIYKQQAWHTYETKKKVKNVPKFMNDQAHSSALLLFFLS